MNNARRPMPPTANANTTGVAQAGPSLSSLYRVGHPAPGGRRPYDRSGAAVKPTASRERAPARLVPLMAMRALGWLVRTSPNPLPIAQRRTRVTGTYSSESGKPRALRLDAITGEVIAPYSGDSRERPATISGGSSERQGAAVGCASPRSTGRGAFYTAITETLGGVGLFLALAAVLTLADWLPDAVVGSLTVETPAPECRKQWTRDSRFVRHCDFHDGRGWIETKKDTK